MKFQGKFNAAGEPCFGTVIELLQPTVHASIDMLMSTGSPRTIISADDAEKAGVDIRQLAGSGYEMTDQFGATFTVSDVPAVITFVNKQGEGKRVKLDVAVRHERDENRPTSIMAIDAMGGMTLVMDQANGLLELST